MNDLVTIVIPVYNVEKYLDRCIESVLCQTVNGYKIILVDDGSTDNSGKKCDDWASKSELVTALHKKNGGLSDARNYGTRYVKTEYVTYIDSDDYVEPQYIELLLKGLDAGADMVVTHHVQEYEDAPRQAQITKDFIELTSEEALKWMCYEKLSTSAWGKLFPKKYIIDDPFPVGKLYEDLWTIYKYIGRSKKVVFNKSQTYHYLQRKGSIRQGSWNKKYFDVMEGANNLLKYINKNYPTLHSAGVFRYFYSANELYVRAFDSTIYVTIIKSTRNKLKKYYRVVLKDHNVSTKYKLQFGLMIVNPELYRTVWKKVKEKND